jgi:hypothetical protein
MPLQNRVAPDGSIQAVECRGTLMGNRGGRIHSEDRQVGLRRWTSRRWISCCLTFKGRQRTVMGAGYTELFFLDEATALAAGHRPCFECRRAAARAFVDAFQHGNRLAGRLGADDIDRVLHSERLGPRSLAVPRDLPDGAMFICGEQPWLVWAGQAHAWAFQRYGRVDALPTSAQPVLTPPCIIAAMKSGYRAKVHASATQTR